MGHHLNEGRWLGDSREFLNDYISFLLRRGGSVRAYSAWTAYALWSYCMVTGDFGIAAKYLPDLVENYYAWERSNKNSSGLFWSYDDRDAMEFSISGSGLRPTLNSYMYGDALAISKIAKRTGIQDIEAEFAEKADKLKSLIQGKLWDAEAGFFKVIPLVTKEDQVADWSFGNIPAENNVREQIGFIPWYFNLTDAGFEAAWKQLTSDGGFFAPYGPTTAEQRHPRFMFGHDGHECLWNGPSWPFATSQTLTAMANLINNYSQSAVNKKDYFELLKIYTRCHYRKKPDGTTVSWIDENLDPYTGAWLSRDILEKWGWRKDKGGMERGKDYNHSTYCDLVITGLAGLRPREDEILEIAPLIPDGIWPYFCLDNLTYHEKTITIVYDQTGMHYGKGPGLKVYADGGEVREFGKGLYSI